MGKDFIAELTGAPSEMESCRGGCVLITHLKGLLLLEQLLLISSFCCLAQLTLKSGSTRLTIMSEEWKMNLKNKIVVLTLCITFNFKNEEQKCMEA